MEMVDVEYGLLHIGERITEARERKCLSERDLGMFTGVTEHEVRSWEASESTPELWRVLELAARCEVTPDWLLGRDLIEEFVLRSPDCWVHLPPGVQLKDIPLEDVREMLEFIHHVERRRNGIAAREG